MYAIYKITNITNGMKYFGYSTKPESRWSEHRKPGFAGRLLTDTILKEGSDNFTFEVLGTTDSKNFAKMIEADLIKIHNSRYPNGYNQVVIGMPKLIDVYQSPNKKEKAEPKWRRSKSEVEVQRD